jgi:hypothetical protein
MDWQLSQPARAVNELDEPVAEIRCHLSQGGKEAAKAWPCEPSVRLT